MVLPRAGHLLSLFEIIFCKIILCSDSSEFTPNIFFQAAFHSPIILYVVEDDQCFLYDFFDPSFFPRPPGKSNSTSFPVTCEDGQRCWELKRIPCMVKNTGPPVSAASYSMISLRRALHSMQTANPIVRRRNIDNLF